MVTTTFRGQKVDITPQQERTAQELLQSFIRKGGRLPSFSGRDPLALARFEELRRPLTSSLAFEKERVKTEKELKAAEIKARERAKPGKVVKTPSLLGITSKSELIKKIQTARQKSIPGLIKKSVPELRAIAASIRREDGSSRDPATFQSIATRFREGLPTTQELKGRLEVKIPPTRKEQLKTQIERNTPELKLLGKSQRADFIRSLIGDITGTVSFGKEKAIGKLTGARDVEGNRLFTDAQARKITDLGEQIVINAAIGAGTGKVVTVGRGAVAKVLPTTLKATKAKKIIRIGAGLGLTAVQLNRVRKTFETSGEDAALLQLIGIVSFGAGFARTGLKTSLQSRKEFEEFARLLKKTIPRGKKAQVSLKKKISKNRFEKLKQLDKKNVERARVVKGEVEKRLLNVEGKTREEVFRNQLKILSDLKKKLKTPEQKANFDEFVKGLIENEIIKLPLIKITKKGIKFAQVKSKKIEVLTPARQRNIQRVQQAKVRNQKRIEKSKLTLGEKYKQAKASTTSEKQKTSELQRKKTFELQRKRQKILQEQRQRKTTKLVNLLRPGLSQKQKQKLIRKTTPRPTKRTPPRRPFFPNIPIPKIEKKGKKKKKLKTVPMIPPSKQGYNVLGKPLKQKKFIKLNRVPLTNAKAKDLGAWLADHSLARTFKIQKVNKTAKNPKLKVPKSYFSKTKPKFRDFRKVKGKKVPLKNKWIEKKGKPLLDTRDEKKKITLLSQLAKLKKKSRRKKK